MSTEKPRPLQGYKESQETKKEIPVDAKKFQEELSKKVTESDESQQGGKRNLKKSELGEEEEVEKAPIAASGDLFSLFMSDKDSDSIMGPQTPQNVKATQAPSSSSKFNIEQNASSSESPLEASLLAEEFSSAEFFAPTGAPIPNATFSSSSSSLEVEATSPSSQQVAPSEQTEKPTTPPTMDKTQVKSSFQEGLPQEDSSQERPGRVEKKETQDTSLLAGKHPSSAQLLKKKKEKTPEIKLEKKAEKKLAVNIKTDAKTPDKAPEKKPLTSLKAATQPPSKPTTAISPQVKPIVSEQAKETYLQQKGMPRPLKTQQAPPVIDKRKIDENLTGKSSTKGIAASTVKTQSDSSKERSKDKHEEKDAATASGQQVSPVVPFVSPVSAPAPIYATLHPQIYELFEKMVGLMTIEQTKGVTTTTVTINMKNSLFDGAKIVLEHYSTAPNSFNVTIAGTPQAQELVNANINDLVAAFQQSKLSFEVNLRRPILLDEYQAFKRKEKTGDEEQKQKKKG